eukprot:g610.t1
MASKRRHSQDDSGYIWFKDTSGEGALNLAWDLGSYISETDKEAGHGKSLRKWVEVMIKTTDGKTIKRKRETETRPFNKSHLDDVEDIAVMNGMNRASLINALRRRFQRTDSSGKPSPLPYTYVSDVLLMMNPFCGPGHPDAGHMYDHLAKKEPSKEYFERGKNPHIRAIGDFAYDDMMEHEKNQAIIVSGESGSGKTFSCGLVLERLTEKSAIAAQKSAMRRASMSGTKAEKKNASPFLEKIKQVGMLLEAFGNAKTVRNDNSSRFGKYLKIFWDRENGTMKGARMRQYLLEKTRVVTLDEGHRNYHIFYWMLKGTTAKERADLELLTPDQYFYLNQNDFHLDTKTNKRDFNRRKNPKDCVKNYIVYKMDSNGRPMLDAQGKIQATKDGDDKLNMAALREQFATVFGKADAVSRMQYIFLICSGILRLGNIDFEADGTVTKKSMGDGMIAAKMLGIPQFATGEKSLANRLATDLISSYGAGGKPSIIVSKCDRKRAMGYRDALAKAIYGRLFIKIFEWCNETLKEKSSSYDSVIGMLDIFGFEIFKQNGFEQMCINYCNEKLQQTFNNHFFQKELKEYEAEGIATAAIDPPDNSATVNLVEMREGFGIIDCLCDMHNSKDATDLDWGKKMVRLYITNKDRHSGKKGKLKKAACLRYDAISQVETRKRHCDKFDDYPHPEFRRKNYRAAGHFEKGEFFTIYHFAGPVDYRVTNFIERNIDKLPTHLDLMCGLSTNPLMQELFPKTKIVEENSSRSPHVDRNALEWVKTNKKTTAIVKNRDRVKPPRTDPKKSFVGYVFKKQLSDLMDKELAQAEPHYIRCIKSNEHRLYAHQKYSFDSQLVLRQLLYAGVLEVISIRKKGYSFRRDLDDFWKECKMKQLTGLANVSNKLDAREGIIRVLTAVTGKPPVPNDFSPKTDDISKYGPYTIGKTKLFGKDHLKRLVDEWRTDHAMRLIQPWGRFYAMQQKYRRFSWALHQLQSEWRLRRKERRLAFIAPLLLRARMIARAVVAVKQLKIRRDEYEWRKRVKSSWAKVLSASKNARAAKLWGAAAKAYVKMKKQEKAIVAVRRSYQNYVQYKTWVTVASKKMVGKRMSDAAEVIAKACRSYDAYDRWFSLETKFRLHNHQSQMGIMMKFVRKIARNHRLVVRARRAKARVKSRRRIEAACIQIQAQLRAAKARAQLVARVQVKRNASKLVAKMALLGNIKIRMANWIRTKEARKKGRALNYIIRNLQLWHFEHEFKRQREAALAIQAFYFYRKHFKVTLNTWRQDAEAAALNGRSRDLQMLLLRTAKKWVPLKRFPNIVNMRDRLRGTSLLYTVVCADADDRTTKYMAQFLMDCGARLLATNYFHEPDWELKDTTPLHASVECGDMKLPLSKFLLQYALMHGESKKAIMQKRTHETNYTLVDCCLEGTPETPSKHYMTLLWLLKNGSRPSAFWEPMCHNQLEDIRRSEKGAVLKKLAYDKVKEHELKRSNFHEQYQAADRRMTQMRKNSVVVPPVKSVDQRTLELSRKKDVSREKIAKQRRMKRWKTLTEMQKMQVMLHKKSKELQYDVGPNASTWVSRAVLAYRHITTPRERRGWHYKDSTGKIFGPFPPKQMRSWFKRGCFSVKTYVRYGDHGAFDQINEFFPSAKEVFPSEAKLFGDLMMALASVGLQCDAEDLDKAYSCDED